MGRGEWVYGREEWGKRAQIFQAELPDSSLLNVDP